MIAIQILNTDALLYQKELELRDEVLRKPLGLAIADDDLTDEPNQIHFVAMADQKLIGVVVLKTEGTVGKLRQMAVSPKMQGQQIGRKLVEALELFAAENGFTAIKLNARHYALGFYEKLGYAKTETPAFEEVGMKHFELYKSL